LRARAIESQCYVMAPAQWGSHGHGRTTYGHALICDPWGTVLAECADGEGVALAEVDPARVASVRRQIPCLEHRRL
jgi:deaminated glutathione amidase